ncbi:succinate dehydrogenase cytochrome b subunit [Rothia aerolata]|uniref:Succinate dehydrogenase Cd n=1 Tax=Rothia aerolata TaxID=1812262 RepID=A0A917IS89_9MICC|nr:succinate dehydrogenase cytochrome b subunit [Rothia aerolata]GGH61874.1 succinate dehydrogenase Cd [Rothia aerolata]
MSATSSVAATSATSTGAAKQHKQIGPKWLSNVLAKYIMAVTGVVFGIFVLVHMYGNLKVYTGAEHFNDYALFLRSLLMPLLPFEGFLWLFRLALLVCLIGHVYCGWLISARARARRGGHKRRGLKGFQSFTTRTMPVTGLVLLFFIIFHILDLTAGVGVAPEGFQHGNEAASYAYQNLIASFSRPLVSLFYLLAMVILFLHLAHGLYAAVSDFGVTMSQKVRSWVILLSGLFALIVMLGNISIPIAVFTGIIS